MNKLLNGLDLFYKVQMPSIFYLVHPVGTVLGRAKYDDYFVAYQNCTVGSNKNIFPKIGKYVTMRPGSKIIGNSKIGNNCDIGINAVVLDQNIKINSIYLGEPKKFQLKLNKKRKHYSDKDLSKEKNSIFLSKSKLAEILIVLK